MTSTSFTADYEKNYKLVKSFIRQSVRNEAVIEDLTAIALTKVYNAINIYNPNICTELSWILEFSKNVVIDYTRSKACKKSCITDNVGSFVNENGDPTFEFKSSSLPSDLIEGKEIKKAINKALASLSENQRNCFNLYQIENRKYEEIADMLGLSLSNVKVLILRAKESLKVSLKATYESL